MNVIVDRSLLLNKFFIPLSRFTDQVILNLTTDSIDCLSYTSTEKQSIILYAKLAIKTEIPDNETVKLNIGSLKKLIQALNCLDDINIIQLNIEKNHIAYKSPETNFKFHLKEDGIINHAPVTLEKIQAITTQMEFNLSSSKVEEILKASQFSAESNKIYITMVDGLLQAELTDKTLPNLDNMNIFLTKDIIGTPVTTPIILKLDIFKTISTLKFDQLNVKANEKGVVIFELKDKEYLIKYITSCLIK